MVLVVALFLIALYLINLKESVFILPIFFIISLKILRGNCQTEGFSTFFLRKGP